MLHAFAHNLIPRGIVVVLTLLAAGTSQCATAAEAPFRWVDDAAAGTCDLFLGDQPVVRYMYSTDSSTKEKAIIHSRAYHHVFGPGTNTLITNGPEGLYPHHRGLFVGWTRTTFDGKTENFWGSSGGETQRHVKFIDRTADGNRGKMTTLIQWNDREGKLVLEEERTVEARRLPTDAPPGYGWIIDWSTVLTSKRGKIELDGDRQHAGFQFRALASVAENNGARYIRPAAFPQHPDAVEIDDRKTPNAHADLGWLAMVFDAKEHPYLVEYHEAPDLPKPSRFSERPYGRFGAFFPLTLEEGKPFKMRYRLVVTRYAGPSLKTAAAGAKNDAAQAAIQRRHDEYRAQISSGK